MQSTKLFWLALSALCLVSLPIEALTRLGRSAVVAGGGRTVTTGVARALSTVGQPCIGKTGNGPVWHLAGFLVPGPTILSGLEDLPDAPVHYRLAQNAPNPFGPSTIIRFDLPAPSDVLLEVFSIDGRKVVTLTHERMPPGRFTVAWDGKDARGWPVPSGSYLYRLRAGDFSKTQRMLLMR